MDFGLIGTLDREDMAKEVAVRLAVRRRFYRSAFVVFAVAVIVPALLVIWISPAASAYILVGAASAIAGTAAILWVAYIARRSGLYEEAGQRLLSER
jgi:hypothetical protein